VAVVAQADASLFALALGLFGQACYGARALIQWVHSERAGRVVVPRSFWIVGLAGATCVGAYAVLVRNAVFLFAVLPTFYVYARNLLVRRPAKPWELAPIAIVLLTFVVWASWARALGGSPLGTAVGVVGSVIYSGRYVVQWWLSERSGQSLLPRTFWRLSIAGSVLLLAYAVHRHDLVMFIAFVVSPIPYARNLVLLRRGAGRAGARTGEGAPGEDIDDPLACPREAVAEARMR